METEASNNSIPLIFAYDDYRAYLKDMFDHLKATEKKFSFRIFAQRSGIASHNFIRMVMNGQRNLSADSIAKLTRSLNLRRDQAEFFEALVYFNQAKSIEDKNNFYHRMQRNKRYITIKEVESDQYEYFSKWYYAAVRELVGHDYFKEDPQWISKTLIPAITTKEASEALTLLFKMNLIERDEKTSKVRQTENTVASAPQVYSLAICNYHQATLNKAAKSIENISGDLRDISACVLPLKESDLPGLKKRILRLRRSLLSQYEPHIKTCDRIYNLNIALHPLTDKIKKPT
jgi:uncharacterized protein (TIGR02147 family)